PKIEDWPVIEQAQNDDVKRINLDTVTREEIEALRSGDNVLIIGKILTGRDAAHKRLQDMYNAGEDFTVDLNGRFIY
ncbi:fumarate hydratase C-terminal domain-containing protein, partial [Francisella tularensis subsp. holarctica]|uniref:fumarate hydratase C-terminal domain-containing protein n=1 Tax=Francisella tularensis TaxID=263 RepID=UPI002381ACE6